MATDYTKLPRAIIVDLINETNAGAGMTEALLDFGLPTVPTGTPARNTELTVTAKAGSGYSGSVTLKYNRVDMAEIPGALNVEYTKGDAENISDLIPEINARYGINLQAEDYVDAPLPNFTGTPNEKIDFEIVAAADSLVWRASLILKLASEDIPLSSVITNDTLNGLVYVAPTEPVTP